jgi:hypothetical protein
LAYDCWDGPFSSNEQEMYDQILALVAQERSMGNIDASAAAATSIPSEAPAPSAWFDRMEEKYAAELKAGAATTSASSSQYDEVEALLYEDEQAEAASLAGRHGDGKAGHKGSKQHPHDRDDLESAFHPRKKGSSRDAVGVSFPLEEFHARHALAMALNGSPLYDDPLAAAAGVTFLAADKNARASVEGLRERMVADTAAWSLEERQGLARFLLNSNTIKNVLSSTAKDMDMWWGHARAAWESKHGKRGGGGGREKKEKEKEKKFAGPAATTTTTPAQFLARRAAVVTGASGGAAASGGPAAAAPYEAGFVSWVRKHYMSFRGTKPLALVPVQANTRSRLNADTQALVAAAQAAPDGDLLALDGASLGPEERADGTITMTIVKRIPTSSSSTTGQDALSRAATPIQKIHVRGMHVDQFDMRAHRIQRAQFLDLASVAGKIVGLHVDIDFSGHSSGFVPVKFAGMASLGNMAALRTTYDCISN